jgi:hypothetical protein
MKLSWFQETQGGRAWQMSLIWVPVASFLHLEGTQTGLPHTVSRCTPTTAPGTRREENNFPCAVEKGN